MNNDTERNQNDSSILLLGTTGFIGRYLLSYLKGQGFEVVAAVRNEEKARQQLGADVELIDISRSGNQIIKTLENVDIVINMARRQLAGVRWTKKKQKQFEEIRINLNQKLAMWMSQCKIPPGTFITASAVGVYGNSGYASITESGPTGSDYLADMCKKWENTAGQTVNFGVRVVFLRLGVVLSREGGVLAQLPFQFEMGIGSYIGNGKQIVAWIHIEDVLRIVHDVIISKRISGPINCTAPQAVTGKTNAKTLMEYTSAKVLLPLPNIILKMLFGPGERVLTNSQNAIPAKVLESGFSFKYNDVGMALEKEFANEFVVVKPVKVQSDNNIHWK